MNKVTVDGNVVTVDSGKMKVITVQSGRVNEKFKCQLDRIVVKDLHCRVLCSKCEYNGKHCFRLANILYQAIECYKEQELLRRL